MVRAGAEGFVSKKAPFRKVGAECAHGPAALEKHTKCAICLNHKEEERKR